MTREQFLAKVRQAYPGSTVVEVAVVLREGWESDNYVALLSEQGYESLVTTERGQLVTASVRQLREAIVRHESAIASQRRLLERMTAG